jgi:hypothetical protein
MLKIIPSLLLCLLASHFAPSQNVFNVDVCVYGGTSAGVIAAYTTSKLGKTAILIEPGKRLGGMSSGGLGYTDIGNKFAVTGLARDFYRRLGAHYGKFEQWTFEPKVAEALFRDYVKRGGFQVLYDRRVKSVDKQDNRIVSITLEDSQGQSQDVVVKAKMFIDTGYEGDLMAKSGVSYAIGRESNAAYNETINGVQLMEGHQFPDGISPYVEPGDPSSGLLWGVSAETLAPNGTEDKKIQAYNFRICLTSLPENKIDITQPEGYDPSNYELLLRLFDAFPDKRKLNDYFIWSKMPNYKTDINNRGGFSTDMIGMNYGFPDGTYQEREAIIKEHVRYTKGLLYFFSSDDRVPEQLRKEMQMWGYPKDEYIDNDNWSPQLYIREARRMIGSYVMTQANCEGKRKVSDGIGLAAYTMDSHNCQRIVVNGQVKNEGNVEVSGFGPYPISYQAIVPKLKEAGNLLVPVCLSATHIAYGSIRMEPVFMVLAQSAATAAVIAIDDDILVQHVNVKKLQQSAADVIVDNEDSRRVDLSDKKWGVKKQGGYGSTYLVHDPDEKEIQVIRFSAGTVKAGRYDLYMYVPKVEGATEFMHVVISVGAKINERFVNTGNLVIEGQTSGEWVSLGQHRIEEGKKPYVEVTTKNAKGKVVADAVIWAPVRQFDDLNVYFPKQN